jgi:hypothetical protein
MLFLLEIVVEPSRSLDSGRTVSIYIMPALAVLYVLQ